MIKTINFFYGFIIVMIVLACACGAHKGYNRMLWFNYNVYYIGDSDYSEMFEMAETAITMVPSYLTSKYDYKSWFWLGYAMAKHEDPRCVYFMKQFLDAINSPEILKYKAISYHYKSAECSFHFADWLDYAIIVGVQYKEYDLCDKAYDLLLTYYPDDEVTKQYIGLEDMDM